jgi:hypothetical protein
MFLVPLTEYLVTLDQIKDQIKNCDVRLVYLCTGFSSLFSVWWSLQDDYQGCSSTSSDNNSFKSIPDLSAPLPISI